MTTDRPLDYKPAPENELYCFLDSARPCQAECMAYLPVRPEGEDYQQAPFSSCMILVNLHKIGKHHVALAQAGANLVRDGRNKAADQARNNQPLPPGVR